MANSNPNTAGLVGKKWNNTPTRAIRVPDLFADELLAIARSRDNGGEEAGGDGVSEAIALLEEALTLRANAGGAIKQKIREALDRLR